MLWWDSAFSYSYAYVLACCCVDKMDEEESRTKNIIVVMLVTKIILESDILLRVF